MANILIIDDDPQILGLVYKILVATGHNAYKAHNPQLGKDIITGKNELDAVITDILMPNTEGFDIIKLLKEKFPDIKIIAISGGGKEGPDYYLKVAKKMGVHHTVSKPFDMYDIHRALDKVLNQ